MNIDNDTRAFLTLVQGGLWERDIHLSSLGNINYDNLYRLAQEQAVVGLVAAGLEHIIDVNVPRDIALSFAGETLQLEQRNVAMNAYVSMLIEELRKMNVYALLIKGQGVAQCYERPIWRACGDIDLFLSEKNYEKAKERLVPRASSTKQEIPYSQHLEMTIDSWSLELHGNLRCGLSSKMDREIDDIQNEVFCEGRVRSWMNGKTQVFLPDANCDTLLVFTHFIKHFYKKGVGIRQICDWCRLLWTYKESVNHKYLKEHLKNMGLLSEWKAFGSFAVEYLGMPQKAMPFYSENNCWKKKAAQICFCVIDVGNMGHNRDYSYWKEKPYFKRKFISFGRMFSDFNRHLKIFPYNSLRFFLQMTINGLKATAKGE